VSALKSNLLPPGVLTAALTPLRRDLSPDHHALVKHLQWLLQRGNDGIALLGTTGEANSFSVEERMRILEAVLDGGIDPGVLLVGTGCCSLTDTIALTRHAYASGVRSMLVLPPFYYKPVSDEGLEAYFAKLLDEVGANDIHLYLYHFPRLTGVPFTNQLVEQLISRYPDNIVGMKDSGGDWPHMEDVLKSFPGFRLYAGTEKFLLPVVQQGGVGCISATANLTSPECAIVYEAWKKGGGDEAQGRVTKLREALEMYPAIGTLKYLLAKRSGNPDWLHVRPPNMILSPEQGMVVEERLRELWVLRFIKTD
jgi:4-hydroxy-tetrahydrodipicolinate synthase